MKTTALYLLGIALVALSCSDNPVNGLVPTVRALDPLEPIDYAALGQGTLVFNRLSGDEANSGVYVVDVENGASHGFGGIDIRAPAVSPDGERILFTRPAPFAWPIEDRSDIFVADVYGGNMEMARQDGTVGSPSWFSDGTEVGYIVHGGYVHGGYGRFHVYRRSVVPEIAQPRFVSSVECGPYEAPSISADGVAIYYTTCGKESSREIESVNLATGAVGRIRLPFDPFDTEDGRIHSPVWSPDDNYIAFMQLSYDSSGAVRTVIKRIEADGTNVVVVAALQGSRMSINPGSQNMNSVVWSPDGSKIAFPHEDEHGIHIYLVGRDGQGLQQITSAPGVVDISLSWAPR